MASNKIIYGIDLGTTNSAIAKFVEGSPKIQKSKEGADTTASCVYISSLRSYINT